MLHYGYADTLAALDTACGVSSSAAAAAAASSGAVESLPLRSTVRKHILAGDIDAAMQLLQQHFPAALQASGGSGEAPFWLHCQQYIELVRAGRVEDAVVFARLQLSGLQGKAPQWEATLRVGACSCRVVACS
jgi:hypothetical protein